MFENFKSLPDFLRPDDLISLGLYASRDSAYWARMKGESPDFIKVGRRVLYPKQSVIEFLEHHTTRWSTQKNLVLQK